MNKKRTNNEKNTRIQELLEKHGKLNADYGPVVGEWTMPDGNYKYRQNFFHSAISFTVRLATAVFAFALSKVVYGAKVIGKENLKKVKGSGAICVCNHFSFLDTLFVRQAVGYFRSYHTVSPINNKKNFLGAFMRHGGILPFSSDFAAMRNLNEEIGRLLQKGKIINFYAEQSLWVNYRKPRPMKRGAFAYAVKYGVPVLPLFCTFGKSKRGKIKKLRINILPPVYADPSLPERLQAESMMQSAQDLWTECYEKAYGIPLKYL